MVVLDLSAQLEQLHEVHEATRDTDFDDRLVLSLLLCLAVGERNLVLRIGSEGELLEKREKREWVKRVGEEVAWICSTIFALSTHRVSCTSEASPTAFLRSLFVPPSPTPSTYPRAAELTRRETWTTAAKNQDRTSRRTSSVPRTAVLPSVELPRPRPSLTLQPTPNRRLQNFNDSILGQSSYFSSEPASLLPEQEGSSAGEDLFPVRPISPRPPSPDRRRSGVRRQTLNAVAANRWNEGGSAASGLLRVLPAGNEMRTSGGPSILGSTPPVSARPLPSASTQRISAPRSASIASPLQALNRPPGTSAQSTHASIKARSSSPSKSFPSPSHPPLRTETSPASLAPDFPSPPPFSPYSPSSTKGRRVSAEIHRKPTAGVAKLVPQVLILERLERSRPSVQQALVDVFRERRIALSSAATRRAPIADDVASMRTRRTDLIDEGNGWEGTFILPKGFIVVAIVCEKEEGEGDGAWGGLSRYLFDHFSLSHSLPSRAFFHPAPTFSSPSTHPLSPSTTPLLSPLPLPPSRLSSHFSPALQSYTSDLLSTLRHHPLLEGRMLTARARSELITLVHAWVETSRGLDSGPIVPQDVVSIVIGVVGHRLKMREAADEKSMFWGSELGALQRREERREGVEGVVRRVAKEV